MKRETLGRYCFHKPNAEGVADMKAIRVKVRALAAEIENKCPESRGKATALTHLDFVMMQANSSIVQRYPIDLSDLTPEEIKEFGLGDEK